MSQSQRRLPEAGAGRKLQVFIFAQAGKTDVMPAPLFALKT
jgi:hypothetical protein